MSATQTVNPLIIYLLFLWTTIWKGLAVWQAAKQNQRNWFIALIVLNLYTIGILEIAYLFFFAKKKFTITSLRFWESDRK